MASNKTVNRTDPADTQWPIPRTSVPHLASARVNGSCCLSALWETTRARHGGDGAIVKAAAQSAITPDEAFKLSQTVGAFVRAIDTSDFDRQLQMVENAHTKEFANAIGWHSRRVKLRE